MPRLGSIPQSAVDGVLSRAAFADVEVFQLIAEAGDFNPLFPSLLVGGGQISFGQFARALFAIESGA